MVLARSFNERLKYHDEVVPMHFYYIARHTVYNLNAARQDRTGSILGYHLDSTWIINAEEERVKRHS